jgi:AcrR family transcriptional regulator
MAGAGLSRTVYYRHFDGLPNVLLTLLRMIEGELVAPMLAPVTYPETSLRELLAGGVDTFARYGPSCGHSTTPPARTRRSKPPIPRSSSASLSRLLRRLAQTSERTEIARALNLMNRQYVMETLGKDPGFDREHALETLLTIWGAVARP